MRRTVTTVTTAMKQRQQQKGPNGLQEVSNRARGSFELSFSAPVKSDNSQALLKPSKGLLWFLGGPESFLEAVQGLPGASGGCRGRPEKPQEGPTRALRIDTSRASESGNSQGSPQALLGPRSAPRRSPAPRLHHIPSFPPQWRPLPAGPFPGLAVMAQAIAPPPFPS